MKTLHFANLESSQFGVVGELDSFDSVSLEIPGEDDRSVVPPFPRFEGDRIRLACICVRLEVTYQLGSDR